MSKTTLIFKGIPVVERQDYVKDAGHSGERKITAEPLDPERITFILPAGFD